MRESTVSPERVADRKRDRTGGAWWRRWGRRRRLDDWARRWRRGGDEDGGWEDDCVLGSTGLSSGDGDLGEQCGVRGG
ncbi:hypothetical protein M0R45_036098 [Rubus argutus]|uniref:Uncharacterized protein n=1 Tax=Rubus argutus TaxID=59490 RepID=A0AAW1VW03_RUBAR